MIEVKVLYRIVKQPHPPPHQKRTRMYQYKLKLRQHHLQIKHIQYPRLGVHLFPINIQLQLHLIRKVLKHRLQDTYNHTQTLYTIQQPSLHLIIL